MDSIIELENYCKTKEPVGALLLTGEWGCGKTFIIEHDLKERLMDSHIIIRVSLFGTPSIEGLHKAVKDAYIHSKGGFFDKAVGLTKFKNFFDKLSNLIPNEVAKNAVGSALSFNLLDFVKVENEIDGKRVVLVFDDLDRSKLSVTEKLGAINEYCENQHFNVIIVADEDKLEEEDYREIKEKVVRRTVYHIPDYESTVMSVINDVENPEYKDFLLQRAQVITALFAGTDLEGNSLDKQGAEELNIFKSDDEEKEERKRKLELIKRRPHNIRSLKSAIQDFERVFTILVKKDIEDAHKWLFSFLSFSMAVKANLIQKSGRYGMLFNNQNMGILYPGFFDSRFLPQSLSTWIFDGSYKEDKLISYIDEHYKASESSTPRDLVKCCRIDYLDENTAIEGMRDILQDVYDGNLELNEYVTFIFNSYLSRIYGLLDLDVDWPKVNSGIRHRIEINITKGEKRELDTISISDTSDYSEEEKTAFSIIQTSRDSLYTMFEVNRREYIRVMKDSPYDAFIHISNKRYNCFDEQMADATLDAFRTVDNPTKAQYSHYFEGMWITYRNSLDIGKEGVEKCRKGFLRLKKGLESLLELYSDQPFKKKFTESFISVIEKLLECDEVSSENQVDE